MANPIWYHWSGLHPEQHFLQGVSHATSVQHLRQTLHQQNILLQAQRPLPSLRRPAIAVWLHLLQQWLSLTKSGFDQLRCWQHLRDKSRSQQLASACQQVCLGIQQGQSLHESMAQCSDVFPSWLLPWIKNAEASGQLALTLEHLIQSLQSKNERVRQRQQALRYPLTVLVVAALLMVFMLKFLVPKFANVYQGMDAQVPALTENLIRMSQVSWLIFGLVAGCGIVVGYLVTMLVRRLHHTTYQLPWLGKWLNQQVLYDDLVMIQFGMQSQIPLLTLCQQQAEQSTSPYWRSQWQRAFQQMQQGRSWHSCWQSTLAPDRVLIAIDIGEQSGQLCEQISIALADLKNDLMAFETQLSATVPALLLTVVSLLTLVILLAIYLPLFQLAGAIAV
ncbi:MAG: type II secretion system F family protein [Aliidiomarina sp.]|uniref:type II secretion system F family protein n=1 Tax=Aliidiomarina sp. TaxID=1872439 RepID=UPI0025C2A8EC|nr:type II secretion system F family protein [Aliidiomarina sp.]MCH8501300.1 type II secretion system F family protein [Aliidiomarina sp.]